MSAKMLSISLVLVGGVLWGIQGVLNNNPLDRFITKDIQKIIYIVVGLAALNLARDRNTYLPFLGKTAVPCSLFTYNDQHIKNKNDSVEIKIKPNQKVIYWAANPTESTNLVDPWKAYGETHNSGVSVANNQGIATLHFNKPQSYKVNRFGRTKVLQPHVHYRVCNSNLMLGPVQTIQV